MSSATPRFVGRIPVAGNETIAFTPPVNPPGNIVVPQGYYYPLGGHGYITSAATSSTQTVEPGHRLVPGDVVDRWRAGIIEDELLVSSVTATTVQFTGSTEGLKKDRLVVQGDLVGTIEALGAGVDPDVRLRLSPETGIVTLWTDIGGGTFEFDFGAAPDLQTVLRLADVTTEFAKTDEAHGTRCVYGSFYPSIPSVDEEIVLPVARQEYETDDGTMTVLSVASKRIISPTVRFLGDWREAGTTLHDFEDFILHAANGYHVRYYPDREVFDRFDRDDQPWGYETCILRSPTRFAPDEVISRARDLWEVELELQRQTNEPG